jgi:hypothetical protein
MSTITVTFRLPGRGHGAEHGVRHSDVQDVPQVSALSGEHGIGERADGHVRIAWRTCRRRAGHAPPGQPQRGSVGDAARDVDGDLVLLDRSRATSST